MLEGMCILKDLQLLEPIQRLVDIGVSEEEHVDNVNDDRASSGEQVGNVNVDRLIDVEETSITTVSFDKYCQSVDYVKN